MAQFEVTYTGRNHPTDMDAVAAGLRVARDGEYLQFFLVAVGRTALTEMNDAPSERWWQALVAAALPIVEEQIRDPWFAPRVNPIDGIPIFPEPRRIQELESSSNELPGLTEGLAGGHPVHAFAS